MTPETFSTQPLRSLDQFEAWREWHQPVLDFVPQRSTRYGFLADVFSIFIFVLWFWLLITIFSDLFRRHDISGWGKAIWVIVLILFSYIGYSYI